MQINLDKYINQHGTGYVIKTAIIKDNKVITNTIVAGNAQIKPEVVPMKENHIFDIASLTKFFTSILVHKNIENKLLSLYDEIKDVDNRFINLDNVRIVDLLSHNVEIWTDGYLGNAKNKNDFYKILFSSYIKSRNRVYADTHYMILSTVLEKIYGLPFKTIVYNEIIKPLGLKETSFDVENEQMVVSNNYESVNGKINEDILLGLPHDTKARVAQKVGINVGHAGIFTTAGDLLKILICMIDKKGKLLNEESIKRMLEYDNIDKEIFDVLSNYAQSKDINIEGHYNDLNILHNEINQQIEDVRELKLKLPNAYNYGGTRYKHPLIMKNDIPDGSSKNSVIFSGYTGPIFFIDYEKSIIIVIMTNVCHNSTKSRQERYDLSKELIAEVFLELMNENFEKCMN